MTERNEEEDRNTNTCRFCEKEIISDKVRDHCHLTGTYRGPAHSKCNNNVTQKKVFLSHLYFTFPIITSVICFF